MEIITKQISELKPYAKNNKAHPAKQIKMIADSISLFGFKNPIIIDSNNEIIAGHGRLLGAKQLGMETVPCIIADDLSEEQVRAYRLLDNKIGDFGEYDMGNILAELGDIGDFQLGLDSLNDIFGIDDPSKEEVEDEIPTIKTDPIVQVGDIFQLGSHRIMCGDSTKKEDVDKLMNGMKADMVFTDPPYGMNLDTNYHDIYTNAKSKTKNQEKVIGDDEYFDPTFILKMSKEVFLWGADYFCQLLPLGGSRIVWDKKIGEGKIGNEFELCWSQQRHKKVIIENEWAGFRGMNEIDGKRVHPTQKPIELCSRFIQSYSIDENVVIDLFLGSGSTLIACEKTNRICYGMELDPKYIEVIIKRYYDYTEGKKDIKIINRDLDLSIITNG